MGSRVKIRQVREREVGVGNGGNVARPVCSDSSWCLSSGIVGSPFCQDRKSTSLMRVYDLFQERKAEERSE